MGSQGSSSHSKLQCTLILPNQTSRACDRAARSATRVQAAATSSADATSATSTLESSVDETLDNTFKKQLSDLGVTTITADQLFDGVHVLKWTPLLLAYFPVGCILAAIRMLAWAGGVSLDASWFRNKAVVDMYMALLGVTVIWEDQHNIPAEVSACRLVQFTGTCMLVYI